jgi:hypothetical protein
MQRAMNIPGLDALSVAEFARGGEAALVALESGAQLKREMRDWCPLLSLPICGKSSSPLTFLRSSTWLPPSSQIC